MSVVLRPEPAEFDALGPQLRIAVWRNLAGLQRKSFASTDRPSTGDGPSRRGSFRAAWHSRKVYCI